MDEFGVLTERYGLKPQGKSTPMAALKRNVNNNNAQNWNLGMDSNLKTKSSSESNSVVGAYLDSLQTNGSMGTPNNGHLDPYDDIFGGPVNPPMQTVNGGGGGGGGSGSFDYDSIFSGSNTNGSTFNSYGNDDIFGGMPGLNSSSSVKSNVNNEDIFGRSTSSSKQSAPIDDLLGGFGRAEATPKTSYGNRSANGVKNASIFDDFIPGFAGSNSPNSGNTSKHPQKPISQPNKATSTLLADPFKVLESASPLNSSYASDFYPLEQMSKLNNTAAAKPPRLKSPPKGAQVMKSHKVKSSRISSIDELEDFAMGRGQNNAKGRLNVRFNEEGVKISANKSSRQNGDDLESFFSMGSRSNSVPKSRATTPDPLFDAHTKSDKPGPTVPQRTSFGTSTGIKKSSSASGLFDDLSSMFGAAQVFGEFEEVEGESEERRRARLGRHQRTQERALKAVADMNQRDMQSQQEQEERRRIAESVDIEIKRWAAGKEGNMRALLSSLHHVLWPECGWQPVSLTDLITSTSVKKVYRKANLCVHPDKVQQKGATLQQKYTAEKVFDILKETWTKFNAEELR